MQIHYGLCQRQSMYITPVINSSPLLAIIPINFVSDEGNKTKWQAAD